MDETPPPDLIGPPMIAVVQILSRAKLTPFTHMDWSGFAGAIGEAHMMEFAPSDFNALRSLVGVAHWDPEGTVVILDESGITFNYMDKAGYAYQAKIEMRMDPASHQVDLASENEYARRC